MSGGKKARVTFEVGGNVESCLMLDGWAVVASKG